MFLSSLLEDKKLYALPSNMTELLRFWQALRHLERTGVIQLAHEEKEGESGEIKLYLMETGDDGQKKQNGVEIHVVVRLTTFGFNFLTALDLIGNRLISIDWDEYLLRPASHTP
jgi:hypothetical protein